VLVGLGGESDLIEILHRLNPGFLLGDLLDGDRTLHHVLQRGHVRE
jgi:hypothetical protein